MIQAIEKAELDAPSAEIARRWKEAGVPDLYEGANRADGTGGPVCRERADNVRAFLYPAPKQDEGKIEHSSIPGPAGSIETLVVWPHPDHWKGVPSGTLVYFHGGGWVVGSVNSHRAHAIRHANRAGVVVVSIEYRLAPEHRYPAAADDSWAATQWVHANRGQFGGAGKPLAVGGDSAGGNLAAVMALQCRDEGIPLAAQLLVYPATNLSNEKKSAPHTAYFGSSETALDLDWRASPALGKLEGIAPAILGVGSHDFLYQDGLAYARQMEAAKVELRLRQWDNLNHGFFSFAGVSKNAEAAANCLSDDLREFMTR